MKAILIILLIPFATILCQAEEKQDKPFTGKKADLEIKEFMEKRPSKQMWLIEYETYYKLWKIKDTMWWVNIVPAPYLEKHIPKLKDLDPKYTYLLSGIPVDQSYGAITFYTTGIIKRPDSSKPFKLDLTVGVVNVKYSNTPILSEEQAEVSTLELLNTGYEVAKLDWNNNYNHYASYIASGTISWPTKDPDIEWKWQLFPNDLAVIYPPNVDPCYLVKKINEPKKPAKAAE